MFGFCAIVTFSEAIETVSIFPVPPTVDFAFISIEPTDAVDAILILASPAFSDTIILSAFPSTKSSLAFGESTITEGKLPSKETLASDGTAITIPLKPSPVKPSV